MRKMASIRIVDGIAPIEGADAIETAVIGGWKVVIRKGEFTVGDHVVYCEIDSWIPTELAPFLSKGKEPREFNGVKGERLRTIKLRGQLSQGLLLNLDNVLSGTNSFQEGDDVSEVLNIQKWERPMNAQLAGLAKGNFPSFIPKTDQERVQNLVKEISAIDHMTFEVTEKLEGSSMTCYLHDGVFGVCSRNLDLKETEGNAFWATARREDIETKMREIAEMGNIVKNGFAIQGELVGPGIQNNIYNLSRTEFYVFDVYDIQAGEYLKPYDRRTLIQNMGLNHVPLINGDWPLVPSVEGLLETAEGKSALNSKQEREGVVFKQAQGGMTFKAISNKYLLGEK